MNTVLLHLPRSSDYLRDHPELVRVDTANYLTMWCVNLEVQEVYMCVIMTTITNLNSFLWCT